ncbi:MAG: membrane protein insertion efficiency factor YidD [Methylocystis sp.]
MTLIKSLAQTLAKLPAQIAGLAIIAYRLSFSAIAGRSCRYAPSCSEYAGQAIQNYGLWIGGWMSFARLCRCRPGGGEGFDPVPPLHSSDISPLTPWRYARWSGPFRCEEMDEKEG